ncbi:MAG: BglII/BstYI family type II restriction endonuclease [Armatimonadota bacterium]|nr:BglII/BstYI family type II restriction endonuclease [Armatimonadota bacterium]
MGESFRHAVGKSTLREGFAVPKNAETWIGAPAASSKRQIRLVFDGQEAQVTLRRLGNERGHVQVKYENSAGEPFRNWLVSRFGTAPGQATGDYFELTNVGDDRFEVKAFPYQATLFPNLFVDEWLFHAGADQLFDEENALNEIPAVVRTVPFDKDEGQNYYNRAFSNSFREWDWQFEGRVVPQLGLKFDFAKNGVQVEVEFGNARTYYQDYIKFLLANRQHSARVGVLMVPSESFAKHLCEVGRRRALEKGRNCYSGMIHFEKVRREFQHLEFLLSMPIAIAGVSPT